MYNVRPCRTSAEGGGGEPFLIANYGIWGVYSTTTTQIPTDTTDPNGQSGKAKVFPSTSRATGWPLWWLTYHRGAKDVKRIHLAVWTWWDCICICTSYGVFQVNLDGGTVFPNAGVVIQPEQGISAFWWKTKLIENECRWKFHKYEPCLHWNPELLIEWPGGIFTRTDYPTSSQSTEIALFWPAPSAPLHQTAVFGFKHPACSIRKILQHR